MFPKSNIEFWRKKKAKSGKSSETSKNENKRWMHTHLHTHPDTQIHMCINTHTTQHKNIQFVLLYFAPTLISGGSWHMWLPHRHPALLCTTADEWSARRKGRAPPSTWNISWCAGTLSHSVTNTHNLSPHVSCFVFLSTISSSLFHSSLSASLSSHKHDTPLLYIPCAVGAWTNFPSAPASRHTGWLSFLTRAWWIFLKAVMGQIGADMSHPAARPEP